MRILLFDPFSGAAGDMIIGALLDCGADREAVSRAMTSVVGEPAISVTERCHIQAVRIETHAGPNPRHLDEVLAIVRKADAPAEALKMTERVFRRIHRAEAAIHGEGAHLHFHEVGADDAIADVVGACTALLSLAPDHVAVRPVRLGSGFVTGAHGRFPIPAPATLNVLMEGGLPVIYGDETRELCTPTGAALLSEFSDIRPEEIGDSTIAAIGYGAGTRNPEDTPNVLRVSLLRTPIGHPDKGVVVLETNVDDVTGEVLAYTLNRLIDEGARDASAGPIQMKKGRSGHLVRVISRPEDSDRLASIMAEELGTLGIREIPNVHRAVADRTFEKVSLSIGDHEYEIGIRIGWMDGRPISLKAEYEDARACAEKTGMPLQRVAREAETAGQCFLNKGDI